MSSNADKYFAYAGITTFLRSPHTREIGDADIVVMGVPFDCGVSNRSGSRSGPQSIRKISLHTGNFHHPWPYDIQEKVKIIDYGDVGMTIGADVTGFMIEETYQHAKKIFNSDANLLTLGGDHTIPYGLMRAAKEKYGTLAMIHFDSHQDTLSGENGKSIFHGTFAHDMAEEGVVDPTKSTQVFIRTDMPKDFDYNIIYAKDALYKTPKELAEQIIKNVDGLPVYITFDVDALDPAYAPGTGTPVPGGPTSAYVRELLQYLDVLNVVAADIVEVAPQYDSGEITALVAGVLACDLLHLIGNSKLRREAQAE